MFTKTSLMLVAPGLLTQTVLGLETDFTILSMNVAGLPAIFNSNDVPGDKTANAESIGSLFSQYNYDIINVQEDFNYHASIYATDTHPYRTPTSGGAGFGSGLNTLANFSWTGFVRVGWNTCSDASGSDCLTPKGFTYMRMLVSSTSSAADGTVAHYVDVYNLHTDAGVQDDDIAARNSNIDQVNQYIATWSSGVPILVFGDTNSRYTRLPDDIELFGLVNDMTDPWVKLVHGGTAPSVESVCDNPSLTDTCETVDKIFYRGSALASLAATDFGYDSTKFLQDNGDILSDHNPIRANFTLSEGTTGLKMSPFFGGPHGDPFSDVDTLVSVGAPKASVVTFRGGSRLDSVAVTLTDETVLSHGGLGGTEVSLALGVSEYWTGATLCQGQKDGHTRNFYIEATTNEGRSVSSGSMTDDCAEFSAPAGWQIVGFIGRCGDEVDQISFLFASQ